MKASEMRARAAAASGKQGAAADEKAKAAYDAAMLNIKEAADRGLRELTYRGYLPQAAIKQLKRDGYKLLDMGENVASIMVISW